MRLLRKDGFGIAFWHNILSGFSAKSPSVRSLQIFTVELDGSQHFSEEGIKRDRFRTERLEGYDLNVIRFTNREIDENFLGVCEYIDFVVKSGMR